MACFGCFWQSGYLSNETSDGFELRNQPILYTESLQTQSVHVFLSPNFKKMLKYCVVFFLCVHLPHLILGNCSNTMWHYIFISLHFMKLFKHYFILYIKLTIFCRIVQTHYNNVNEFEIVELSKHHETLYVYLTWFCGTVQTPCGTVCETSCRSWPVGRSRSAVVRCPERCPCTDPASLGGPHS